MAFRYLFKISINTLVKRILTEPLIVVISKYITQIEKECLEKNV